MKLGVKRQRHAALSASLLLATSLIAACAVSPTARRSRGDGVLQVVAGESFWGSLAKQLGGNGVNVTSIVTDPNADPHEYSSSTGDARLMAAADYVILNGAGYDSWASKLLFPQPPSGRRVLTVATLLGKKDGDNPHFWYDPSYVRAVIDRITADYKALVPRRAAYFSARYAAVQSALAPYRARLSYIQRRFTNVAVAATESVFQYLARYLRLNLVTPQSFMTAVSEANDPPASSEATFVRQIRSKAFKLIVYNVQTITPLTTMIERQAAEQKIPAVGFSETIQPPSASFEDWMDGQLVALTNALNANALAK